MKEKKLLSIITIHYNDFDGLKLTYNSLLGYLLRFDWVEWIVIDGGTAFSTEQLKELKELKQNASIFISERDEGIYDAMNKGLDSASGIYSIFMNAGDLFYSGLDMKRIGSILRQYKYDLLYGSSGEGIDGSYNIKAPRNPKFLWWGMPTHHQAMFFRTDIANKYRFKTNLKIAADYNLVCDLYANNYVIKDIDDIVCNFNMDGLSSNYFFQGLREQHYIRRNTLKINFFSSNAIYALKVFARIFRSKFGNLYNRLRYVNEK